MRITKFELKIFQEPSRDFGSKKRLDVLKGIVQYDEYFSNGSFSNTPVARTQGKVSKNFERLFHETMFSDLTPSPGLITIALFIVKILSIDVQDVGNFMFFK